MDFHNPAMLLNLFWIIPLILLLIWYATNVRKSRVSAFAADGEIAAGLTTNVSPGRRRLRSVLFVVGIGLIVGAAARPYWGSRLVERPVQSRDVLIVLDTSRSMLAKDVLPSRMQHAKLFIRKLVASTPGDRYGLIAFAGTSFLECPLTEDRSGFLLFLDDIDTNSIPVGGTNIESALRDALKAFEGAEGHNRGVVLITDGDELDGDFTSVLAGFKDKEIPIFVVGIGDPGIGTFIQIEGNKFITDKDGNRVKTRLNQAGLQKLAGAVGGTYVHSSAVHDGLDHIIAGVRTLVPDYQTQNTVSRPIERYQLPLLLGVLCLLVRLMIGERRRRPESSAPAAAVAAGLVLLALPCAAQDAPPIVDQPVVVDAPAGPGPVEEISPAQRLMETVHARLEDKLASSKTDREKAFIYYNMGVNYRQGGDLYNAEHSFEDALTIGAEFPEIRAAAYQNLGVMRHQAARDQMQADPDAALGELTEARSYYREALRANPNQQSLAENQERALYDKVTIEQIKKLMEQYKDQHQQAQDKTGEAKEAQEQANAEQDESAKQDKQQEAAEKSAEAEQSLRDLADKAREQDMDQAAESIEQAADQVQQARQDQQQAMDEQQNNEQREGAGQAAEDKLEAAHPMMGGKGEETEDPGDDQQNADNNDQNGDQGDDQQGDSGDTDNGQDGQDDTEQAQNSETDGDTEGQETAAARAAAEELNVDRQQAVRILEDMQRQEQDLKRRMKQVQAQRRAGTVEKDW
jgi:Ca-activated chloride channel family protein